MSGSWIDFTEDSISKFSDLNNEEVHLEIWAQVNKYMPIYEDTDRLILNKNMWDVLNRNKEGLPKDHNFLKWG